jgi:lysophospholipase L1-like esterase
MDIFCFGDSITLGEYDSERGGWVDRLKTECMERHLENNESDDCVFNLGIGGETSRMMRQRFAGELKARLDSGGPSLVLLAYGANDAATKDGTFLVPLEEFLANLRWALQEARDLGCETCLLNISPIAPDKDGVLSASGKIRSNADVKAYNTAIQTLAEQEDTAMVNVHGEFQRHDLGSLFVADGIHPNAQGHELIWQAVRKQLNRKLRSEAN